MTMLTGLYRRREARTYGLWRLLWNQCIVWIMFATLADVPAVVLIILDLNGPMDAIFLPVESLIMALVVTRIYRSLSSYSTRSTESAEGARSVDLLSKIDNPCDTPMKPFRTRCTAHEQPKVA